MEQGDQAYRSGPTILGSAWRYRRVVAAAAVLGLVGGFLLSSARDARYEAETRLFLADPRSGGVFDAASRVDPERYVPQQAERVTSTPVLERTTELLGEEAVSTTFLRNHLSAEGDVELDMITITATAGDAELAAQLANTAAAAYREVSGDVKLAAATRAAEELQAAAEGYDAQIAELQREIDQSDGSTTGPLAAQLDILVAERIDLTSRAQQLIVDAKVFGSGVDLTEIAEVPREPASPQPLRDAILLAILAVGATVAVVYWRAGVLRRVTSRKEPADLLGVPLIGSIPLYGTSRPRDSLAERLDIPSDAQESYHLLLASLLHEMGRYGSRSVMVTSASAGDGKTEVAFQLGVAARVENRPSALVDGDLRVARLTNLTGLYGATGLVDLTGREHQSVATTVPIFDHAMDLTVVPAGIQAWARTAVLRDGEWVRGLRELHDRYELLVVDSAPILATADTSVLSSHVDAMIVVVREGVEARILEEVRERLAFVGTRILGYVYIGRDASTLGAGAYGYGYQTPRAGGEGRSSETSEFDLYIDGGHIEVGQDPASDRA